MEAPAPQRYQGHANAAESSVATKEIEVAHAKPPPKRFVRQQIPDHILNNVHLQKAMKVLPANYNFEIMKTVWRIQEAGAKRVALQFPEGLLMYACVVADLLETFAGVEHTFVMGDVTYGACCIDDFSAAALHADLMVHYGHSCLVPVSVTKIPCLYVFVDIQIDLDHLVDSVVLNFKPENKILLAGTIQFVSGIQVAKRRLEEKGFHNLVIPQQRPLSAGETLGCTAPVLRDHADLILFVSDGRFHLEAIMIANPSIPAYRYDPYGRVLTREEYDHRGMRDARRAAVEAARGASSWGLVLGTLGRQGNPATLRTLQKLLEERGLRHSVVLLSEVMPWKLDMMPDVDAWIQVACPRLSIDWGEGFKKPTLTPYEAMVALGALQPWWQCSDDEKMDGIEPYPMDYYSKDGGSWNSSYHKTSQLVGRKQPVR